MDTILLRSFLAVAELGSFSAAAARMNASQSTISGHIGRLEEQLLAQLFRRTTRKCSLSAAGEALLPLARDTIRAIERIEEAFRPSFMGGMIRLGVPDDYHLFGPINRAVHEFQVARPAAQVLIDAGLSANHSRALRDGLLDLAVLREVRKSGDVGPPASSLVWIGSPTLKLRPDEPIPLAHINGPCRYFRAATDALDQAGISWRPAYSCSALEGVRSAVRSGMAASAILAEDCHEPELLLDLPWLPQLPEFSLAFHFAKRDPPVLIRALEKRLREEIHRGHSAAIRSVTKIEDAPLK